MTDLDAAFILGMIHAIAETQVDEIVENPFDRDQRIEEWARYLDGKMYVWTLNPAPTQGAT